MHFAAKKLDHDVNSRRTLLPAESACPPKCPAWQGRAAPPVSPADWVSFVWPSKVTGATTTTLIRGLGTCSKFEFGLLPCGTSSAQQATAAHR